METIALLLLYALSQKPDFAENIKPLFGDLKNTEEVLKFLNDLRKFSDLFSAFKQTDQNGTSATPTDCKPSEPTAKKTPPVSPTQASTDGQFGKPAEPEIMPSPTAGIASEYIEKSLQAYFKKR